MALGDDLVADGRVERAVHVFEQQGSRIVVIEPIDGQGWEPGQGGVAGTCPRSAHTNTTRSARRRRATNPRIWAEAAVQPLRVVDDAGKRLPLGELRQQR